MRDNERQWVHYNKDIQVSDLQRVSCGLKAQLFHSPGPLGDEGDACLSKNALGFRSVSLCAPCVSRCGLKAQKYLAQGKRSGALGWGKQM